MTRLPLTVALCLLCAATAVDNEAASDLDASIFTGVSSFEQRRVPTLTVELNLHENSISDGNAILIQEQSPRGQGVNPSSPRTRSQLVVDSIIRLDSAHFLATGLGLYVGNKAKLSGEIANEPPSKCIRIDCYDALRLTLQAEFPKSTRTILRNSRDKDGKFSAPFMLEYLIKHRHWEAYGYYDSLLYPLAQSNGIQDKDLAIRVRPNGTPQYKSGGASFPLKNFVSRTGADSLLKALTDERGFAIGIQRNGDHCYVLVQEGLFEGHLSFPPLGYPLENFTSPGAFELHPGRYYGQSSVAVFAFPPNYLKRADGNQSTSANQPHSLKKPKS